MKLMFCSCFMCRYGRKHYGNPKMITKIKRHARRLAKQMIKHGEFEIPERISVPYCD